MRSSFLNTSMLGGVQQRQRIGAVLLGLSLAMVGEAALAQTVAPALPSGGAFVRGQGQISQTSPTALSISQSTQRGVIDWTAFSIGTGSQVNIANGLGATLNRVLGGDLSRIDGLLSATGSVYLINPHGVIVGSAGRIISGGNFVASTRETSIDAFMAGGPTTFAGSSEGAIINEGEIVSQRGDVVLIARSVTNHGVIEARQGRASLAAADEVLLTSTADGDSGIYVSVGGGGDVTQDGRIQAAAASLTAAGGNIYALAGNRDGLIQASGTETIDGQLWLSAPKGEVVVSGTLAARSADGSGGRIAVTGKDIRVAGPAVIDASGTRGGEVVIGAPLYGTGTDLAETATIDDGARILAGGPAGGGRIETSGKRLDIGAAAILPGAGGTWLIDPDDLTIDAAAASTMVTTLNTGADVTQQTTAGGTGGSGDITVAADVVWTGAGDLTLDAYRDLQINSIVSGGGAVTLLAGRDVNVGAAVSGTAVTATAANATTIASGGQITSTAGDIVLTTGVFTNQSGADALAASGRWLVYSGNPANDAPGGLTPDFYQYAAATGATPAAGGNALLYSIAPIVDVTLGAVTKSYDGTTTATLDDSNTTVSGLINGDDWTLDGEYATKDAATGLTVTADNFVAAHNGIAVYGYGLTSPTFTANTGVITPAVLTATVIGTPTKTYNGTTTVSVTAANLQLDGVAAGETITVNGAATSSYDSANAGARIVTGTFTTSNFVLGPGVLLSNYVLPTSATGAGLINLAPLTISGVFANNKVYDSTTAATLDTAGATMFGVIAGETVTLDASGATGTFATKNVGTGIAVTASGFGLSGAGASNYALAQPTDLTADITKANLVVTAGVVNDKVYDGTTTATVDLSAAVLNGLYAGDDVDITAGSFQFASKNVGTDITVTAVDLVIGGADGGNYTVSSATPLQADITPRPLNVALTGFPTRVYDGTTTVGLSLNDFTVTGFVAGESASLFQASGANYASKNVGVWDVSVVLAPSDFVADAGTLLSNYTLTSLVIQGLGEITPAPLHITIVGNPTKTYDGNTDASLGPSNFDVDGFVAGEGATVTETDGQYSSPDAGTRTVTAELDESDFDPDAGTLMSNYFIPPTVSGTGTIIRRDLGPGFIYVDITGNPTKVYDGNTVATLDSSDYTLDGFIAGEGATVTETVGTYADKDAGQKAVLVLLDPTDFVANSGTNLDNYNLPTEATGVGTILRAPVLVSIIGNPTKVYNGSTTAVLTAGNYAFTGLVAGESISVAPTAVSSYDSRNVGPRTITTPLASNLVFAPNTLQSNYILPLQATGPGAITPAPLTILGVQALSKIYDQTTLAQLLGAGTLFGLVPGDDVTLSNAGATGTFATANVGTGIAVTASGFSISGGDVPNYTLFQPSGLAANITPKGLVIANVDALDKPYDGTTDATLDLASATLLGVIAGDTVTLDSSGADGVFRQKNVGTSIPVIVSGFTLGGAGAGNYSLSQPSGVAADITQAILTGAIIGNPTKTYDGSVNAILNASNYSLTGFVAGEGGAITQSSNTLYDLADAGARTVTATVVVSDFVANSGTLLSNYQLPTTISGPGTINRATLLAAIIGNPTKVYDNTTAATLTSGNYSLSGFVSGEGATVTETVGTYDSDNAGARTVTASLDTGDFTGTGSTNLANYDLPTIATGAGTITQAQVQVINISAQNKVYDGNTNAILNTGAASLTGVFGGDTVTVDSGAATGTFATKNVGTSIVVTAAGFAIAGADAANYTVLQPTGLFADITQATLTLASVTRVYDATTSVPTIDSAYTLSGVVAGDVVTVAAGGITGAYDNKNVGSGKAVTLAGVAIDGADSANYTIAPTTTNAPIGIITPATLQVTGVSAQNKTYDQSPTATLVNSSAGLTGVLGTDVVTLETGGSNGQFVDGNGAPTANAGTWDVATAGYAVSGVDAGNYIVAQPDYVTATINPRLLTLTYVIKTYDGGTTLPTSGTAYGFDDVLPGDDVSVDGSAATGSYADKNVAGTLTGGVVTGGISVTVSNLTLVGNQRGNYTTIAATTDTIGVITPKALTAAIIGNPTKTYDALNTATLTAGDYAFTGFVAGESATVSQTAGTYDSVNAGARTVTASISGFITGDGGTLLSNYVLPTSASGAGTINQAPLTILGVIAQSKVYDGNTNAALLTGGATLSGIVAAETATITINDSAADGQFAQAEVGTNIAVTATGFTIDGDVNNNYTLSQPTGLSANITQALLDLIKVTRVYTSGVELPTASSAYTLSGIVAGDVVTVDTAGLSGAYEFKNVGTNLNVTINGLALAGADAGNYSIGPSLTLAPIGEITPATVTLAGMLANNKVYDGTTALILNNSGTVVVGTLGSDDLGVDSSGSSAVFGSPNVGTYLVDASGYLLTGVDAGNYILTQPTGLSASITPKTLLAAIVGTPTRTYNGLTSATLTSGNYSLTGFVGAESATVTETAGVYDSKNAGARIVTADLDSGDFVAGGGTLLSNYTLPTTASGAGQIDQAVLAVTIIGNPTKVYDGTTVATLDSGNYGLTGFVSGESATVSETVGAYDLADAGSRTVTASLGAGDFTAGSGTDLANYVLPTSATGAGTISQATLIALIIGDPTKVYDGTTAATLTSGNYSLVGFVAGQGATVTETVGVYGLKDAGPRTVTATLGTGDFTAAGPTNLANYILPTTASGLGTITQATLTAAIVGNPTRAYNGTTAAVLTSANYSLSGFVAGEGATVTETVGVYGSKDAGVRTVTATLDGGDFIATGPTLLSNYVLPASAAGLGTITQAILTASIIGVPTKTYDGTQDAVLNADNYEIDGFVAGEGATITETAGLYGSPNVGIRLVTAQLDAGDFAVTGATLLSNYVLPTEAQGFGAITKALLTATIIGNPTKVYDGLTAATLTSANYSLTGFVAGQGATITETVGTYDSKNAGARTVTAALGSADFVADGGTLLNNYALPTTATGAGTITQATLIAAIVGNPTKTYDGTIAATLTASDYSLIGFVAGEGATVTETVGVYGSKDAGPRAVTASLGVEDFSPLGPTLMANYALPATAVGLGQINRAAVTASIIGNPSRAYDGTTTATLTSANYGLSGVVAGETITVTQTTGVYGSKDAGLRTVTAALATGDFTAGGGTLLSNYDLPTSASGLGTITRAVLAASIIGNPTKTYDGLTSAALTSANYDLTGFIAGEDAEITETLGTYDSKNAGPRTVTATLEAGDYTAVGATLLSNYELPVTATGAGQINQASLAAAIVDNPTRAYDGTTVANLTAANYALVGFVAGEGATVTETVGTYGAKDVGIRTVTATLDAGDFAALGPTLLSNYVLPTTAAGLGRIDQATLVASIVGNPSKVYDGLTAATLTSGNYAIAGFAAGEGATVTETVGLYDSKNAGARTVTAALEAGDFTADGSTLLSNYILPTTASGAGTISQAMLIAAIIGNPTKTYDGTTTAALTTADYNLIGFVAGENATITETVGQYGSKDAGLRAVTASLGGEDFNPLGPTLMANYVLPTTAAGFGQINRAAVTAAIIGNPSRAYDGTTNATLAPANYGLSGVVAGETITVTQTTGVYGSKDAGLRTVTATLATGDFTADAGTLLSNYDLPTSAGGLGTITRAVLAASIIGNPTKTYDGLTSAALTAANYDLTGFVAGEDAEITETLGTYDSKNAGSRTVTATLEAGDFSATGSTLLSNYVLPTSAVGGGFINQAALSAAIVGNPTRVYDGTTIASLTAANYSLTGFVAGESGSVTETVGAYDSKNAGARTVTAALGSSDFAPGAGTLLSNYVLPTSATGVGQIDRATVTAKIVGNPTKVYDGTTVATLTPANYALGGFVAGEGATVSETVGAYDSSGLGNRTVTAALDPADFAANGDTLLSNYNLPATATGPGQIIPEPTPNCVTIFDGGCAPDVPSATLKLARTVGNFHFYIPFPVANGLYLGRTNALGSLPLIVEPYAPLTAGQYEATLMSTLPVANSTSDVLFEGGRDKQWTIRFEPPPPSASLGGTLP